MFEIQNFNNYINFKKVCENLQNSLEKGQLGVQKSNEGCYPVPIEPTLLEWAASKILNSKISKGEGTMEVTHGVEKNLSNAIASFKKVSNLGHEAAQKNLVRTTFQYYVDDDLES